MLRNKHTNRVKHLKRLQAELNDVEDKIYSQPNVKLDKPYKSGWEISFSLREDIGRSKKGRFFSHLVRFGTETITTRNVKTIRAIRSKKLTSVNDLASYLGRYYQKVLKEVSQKAYDNLSVKQQKYFYSLGNGYYQLALPDHYISWL